MIKSEKLPFTGYFNKTDMDTFKVCNLATSKLVFQETNPRADLGAGRAVSADTTIDPLEAMVKGAL